MRNPAPPAVCCAASLDDRPQYCLGSAGLGYWAGDGFGTGIWFPPAFAPEGPLACGFDFCCGSFLGLGLSELRDMPWGHSTGGHCGDGAGCFDLGDDAGKAFAAALWYPLEGNWTNNQSGFPAIYQNFANNSKNFEKSICIYEKKGYNSIEYVPEAPAQIRRIPK